MSSEKKISLLIFSLIILMVACVYTHVPDLMKEQGIVEDTEVVDRKPKEEVNKEVVPKPLEKVKTEELIEQKPISETPQVEEKVEESTETIVEEKVEENLEPLVTTDKRYKRTGNEKSIEDLSRTAQELQLKMSEFVKENPIIFEKDSFTVAGKSDETVQKVAEALIEFSNMKIEVAGHTDASGAADVNRIISKERAKSVRARLISLGVEKTRIKARGYGENIPLEGLNKYSKQNRRVEFNIIEE